MSTETVPAIERANQLLSWLDEEEGRRALALRPDLAAVTVASAQVHATLALVEQQRIANLIGYVQMLEMQYAESAKHPDEYDQGTRADSVRRHGIALDRIREGLGLS